MACWWVAPLKVTTLALLLVVVGAMRENRPLSPVGYAAPVPVLIPEAGTALLEYNKIIIPPERYYPCPLGKGSYHQLRCVLHPIPFLMFIVGTEAQLILILACFLFSDCC